MSAATAPAPRKVLFIGMNNHQGNEAFWPAPVGSAGERLWRMVNEAVGWDRETFLMRTDRVNFCTSKTFRPEDADARCEEMRDIMRGRPAVVLVGEVVTRLLDGPETWLEMGEDRVVAIPHTAGLNRFYNKPENRNAVIDLLREVLS